MSPRVPSEGLAGPDPADAADPFLGDAETVGCPPPESDYWLARAALAAVIGLQLFLGQGSHAGAVLFGRWVLPVLEGSLLVLLSVVSVAEQARRPRGAEPHPGVQLWVRRLAIGLISFITLISLVSLVRLIGVLLDPRLASGPGGVGLLADAANLWVTNVVCFALCFWELDQGGPTRRGRGHGGAPDFLFANMTLPARLRRGWGPGFIDYLFLAFTNASAFSPTDALPLTRRAKLLMMVQAAVSLLTVAVVAARAVNILA